MKCATITARMEGRKAARFRNYRIISIKLGTNHPPKSVKYIVRHLGGIMWGKRIWIIKIVIYRGVLIVQTVKKMEATFIASKQGDGG